MNPAARSKWFPLLSPVAHLSTWPMIMSFTIRIVSAVATLVPPNLLTIHGVLLTPAVAGSMVACLACRRSLSQHQRESQ